MIFRTILKTSLLRVLTVGLVLSSPMFLHAQTHLVVTLASDAQPAEKIAADELIANLGRLYPSMHLSIGTPTVGAASVYLGTTADLPANLLEPVKNKLIEPDSFVVEASPLGHPGAVIAGANPRATLYAVDALLEKLGFGFFLSYNTVPSPSSSFNFDAWHLADSPIVSTRTIFEWHNFLSGCSTWNLPEWQQWIEQSSRLRFNTIMVHAYGNNPMFSFTHNGITKPTGYLADTEKGRDWGTEHVEDVRNIVGADRLFDSPVFGADAAKVPDAERVQAATQLMQQVFRFAATRGMNVTFALDVDTDPANPQNIIGTLPASARFASHGIQMANPDTPEGYAYYKSEMAQLMKLYPEITTVALWFRGDLTSTWRSLQPEEFPEAWRSEYKQALEHDPALKQDPQAPGLFALGKVGAAFRKALNETGHADVLLAAGSWRFAFLQSADAFMPKGTVLMPLDYNYEFPSDPSQEAIRTVARHRPVYPIIWAQHDDREFAGRSYVPFGGLASTLQWGDNTGYGVIHWTTRPLDLYFKNVADQVWTASRNEELETTAANLAAKTFGTKARGLGTEYLMDWIRDAPAFGRETSDLFIDQTLDVHNATRGARTRLALLAKMEPLIQDSASLEWLRYFQDWELYAEDFYRAQDALQLSEAALKKGDSSLAREEILKAEPETAIEQYAKAIHHGGTNLGEKGILISLNLRWLPYFVAQRQAVGLEPIEYVFKPTVHESLAQMPGAYTFAFDPSHRMMEVLGEAEIGIPILPQLDEAQCSGGMTVTTKTSLTFSGFAGTQLTHGTYDVLFHSSPNGQLIVEANGKQQSGSSPVDVEAVDGSIRLTLASPQAKSSVCGVTIEKIN
jgi:hypothetical protein